MYNKVESKNENISGIIVNSVIQQKRNRYQGSWFEDNRPAAFLQGIQQEKANNSSQVSQLIDIQNKQNDSVQLMRRRGDDLEGAYYRVDQFGNNWSTLDRSTYLRLYGLKELSSKYSEGKYIQTLSDGSIIITDTTGQYWRHEHAENQDQYYDAQHQVNGNNALTHFWMSEKQKSKIQAIVQL